MANPSNGKQQISTFYGKDLRSLYANQELYGIVRPGVYNAEIVPEEGSTSAYVKFRIKAGATFVFQDTAEEYPGEGFVPLLGKIFLDQDAVTPETTIASLPANNIILYAVWIYDTSPANRYMTFQIDAYSNITPDFNPDPATRKLTKLPIAIIKNLNLTSDFSTNFGTNGQAVISYLEFSHQLDIFNDWYSSKNPIQFTYIKPTTGPGIISLISGQVIGAHGVLAVEFYNSSGTTKVAAAPTIAEISTLQVSTSTYYDLGALLNKDFTPDTTIFSNLPVGIPSNNYLNRANYGYTWISIPDSPIGVSTIDTLILMPHTANDLHSSTYRGMTNRPKLRFFRTVIDSENLTISSPIYSRSLLKNEILNKLSNKLLNIKSGFILGFIVRGFNETGFTTKNILPWSQFIPNFGGIQQDRLFVPILEE